MDLHFAEKCIIFVLAKRREPIDKGFSPLFSCENAPKNHCFTQHIEKFICRRKISTGFCGNFSGQVGARNGDIGNWKVKIHLFSTLHFFHFRVLLRCYWQNKNLKNPLHLMQNVSGETLMLWLSVNPWASSAIFSQPQHHPIGFCIKCKAINRK